MHIAFITPTRNRPVHLARMLRSLAAQTRPPDQVIVVDASNEPDSGRGRQSDSVPLDYVRWTEAPSSALQRNDGIARLRDDIDLVCFFDDDQELHPDAVESMVDFWESASPDIGAASFNEATYRDSRTLIWRKLGLGSLLGLYSRQPGRVSPSGWHSLYGQVDRNTECDWLSSKALVVRRPLLDTHRFDPFFEGYSYLEDLEFTYGLSRHCRLVIVADAQFDHHQPPRGDDFDWRDFGRREVRNRLYFVRKHGLSVPRCYLGLLIRLGMTLGEALFTLDRSAWHRALGNAEELSPPHRRGIRTE